MFEENTFIGKYLGLVISKKSVNFQKDTMKCAETTNEYKTPCFEINEFLFLKWPFTVTIFFALLQNPPIFRIKFDSFFVFK